MFSRILYPLDFSISSLHALKSIIPQLIKMDVKQVFLAYIYEGMISDENEADLVISHYSEKLDKYADNLKNLGANVKTIVEVGIASEKIANIALKFDVDLIVIPSKGENIFREMFLGSTASNLIRLSKKPLLLLKYEWDKKTKQIVSECNCENVFKKPLVALDFSKCSDELIKLLKYFNEFIEEIVVAHIVDYGKQEEKDRLIEESKRNIEDYVKTLTKPYVKRVSYGIASKNIMKIADDNACSLIVIGKKGRSHIKDLLLGSTAERLIRESKKPLLLNYCQEKNEVSYIE